MKAIALLAAPCIALGGFALSGYSENSITPSVFSDPRQTVSIQAGQDFIISLESNPTTGYSWKYLGSSPEGVVEMVGNEFRPPEIQRKGAGGKEEWRFRSLKAGKTVISFQYVRPWEKNVQPKRTADFKVVVLGPASLN